MGGQLQRRRLQAASLWVLRENESARRFYEKLGGDITGDKKDIREDGVVFVEVAYGFLAHWPGEPECGRPRQTGRQVVTGLAAG
jgi:hypothetical protein